MAASGSSYNWNQGLAGLTSLLGGIFGKPKSLQDNAEKGAQKAFGLAADIQAPWYQAGKSAIPEYETAISKYSDPQAYFNQIMNGYSMSPYAQYQEDQAMRAGTNAASASGLSGSTPYANEMEQTASNISSQDMDKYFSDIMGINHDYTQGLNTLMSNGQTSANSLTAFLNSLVKGMGRAGALSSVGTAKAGSDELAGLMAMAGGFLA